MSDAPTFLDHRVLREVEVLDGTSASRPEDVLRVFETHVPLITTRLRSLAREVLLTTMFEIARTHWRTGAWPAELSVALWRAVVDGPETLDDETVTRVEELSELAGGWYHRQPEALSDPEFVELEEWRTLYAQLTQAPLVDPETPEDIEATIARLSKKLEARS